MAAYRPCRDRPLARSVAPTSPGWPAPSPPAPSTSSPATGGSSAGSTTASRSGSGVTSRTTRPSRSSSPVSRTPPCATASRKKVFRREGGLPPAVRLRLARGSEVRGVTDLRRGRRSRRPRLRLHLPSAYVADEPPELRTHRRGAQAAGDAGAPRHTRDVLRARLHRRPLPGHGEADRGRRSRGGAPRLDAREDDVAHRRGGGGDARPGSGESGP